MHFEILMFLFTIKHTKIKPSVVIITKFPFAAEANEEVNESITAELSV